jgi:SHS2 domain-containing protein
MGRWKELDHTADVAVSVRADDWEDLLVTATQAMFSLLAETGEGPPSPSATVTLEAVDREALLVDWLNELLYLHERDEIAVVDITFEQLSNTELQARVKGVPVKEYYANIKAATFHNLEIERGDDGLQTAIVFDV